MTSLSQTVDSPYSPRVQKLMRYARALDCFVCWTDGRWGLCSQGATSPTLRWQVDGERLRLLPQVRD